MIFSGEMIQAYWRWNVLLLVLGSLGLSACSHQVREDVAPDVSLDKSYSLEQAGDAGRKQPEGVWWQVFADPLLDDIVRRSLAGNFDLKQAYARLRQADMMHGQATARLLPELSAQAASSSTWPDEGDHQQHATAELELAWEVDLWRRLSAAQKAESLDAGAAADAAYDTALLLSAQVADTYFQIIEQNLQLDLLAKQLEVNTTFLELIELRFANGAASVVDIYQQRQLEAAIRSQIPKARAKQRTLQHRLLVLLGESPSQNGPEVAEQLPELGHLPDLGLPADLLTNRPDLRVAQKRLVAADYRVAEAIANRLPQVKLFASGGIDGSSFSSHNLFTSVLAQAVAPLVDWGRRRKEVERRRAIVEEELARYSQAFLVAIEEVENALWLESEQQELIRAQQEQLTIAQANLSESRNRYMQGLTDYLPVLTALNSMQGLERDLLTSRRQLISQRILLCRALGGNMVSPMDAAVVGSEKQYSQSLPVAADE